MHIQIMDSLASDPVPVPAMTVPGADVLESATVELVDGDGDLDVASLLVVLVLDAVPDTLLDAVDSVLPRVVASVPVLEVVLVSSPVVLGTEGVEVGARAVVGSKGGGNGSSSPAAGSGAGAGTGVGAGAGTGSGWGSGTGTACLLIHLYKFSILRFDQYK